MPRSPSSSQRSTDAGAALPGDAGPVLTAIARAAISAEFGLRLGVDGTASWLAEPGASFVTLTTRGCLHGCIGSLEARRALGVDVAENAVAAAFRDYRFPALTKPELAETVIEVSVLSTPQPLEVVDERDACSRLRPGVDGVVLIFDGRRATFLPQVWDKLPDPADFLARLKVKAGLLPDFWDPELRLARYSVTEFHEPPGEGVAGDVDR